MYCRQKVYKYNEGSLANQLCRLKRIGDQALVLVVFQILSIHMKTFVN